MRMVIPFELRGTMGLRGQKNPVVCQLALAGYRQHLLNELEKRSPTINFLVGDRHFASGFVTDVDSRLVIDTGRNLFLAGRRLAWQRGVTLRSIGAPAVVIELNPRILTSWLILLGRLLLQRPTSGWGHAQPRQLPTGPSVIARRLMQRLCESLILYTKSEAETIETLMPGKQTVVAANAVYPTALMQPVGTCDEATDFVMIGRLVEEKKPRLAIEAFSLAVETLPASSRLHVVGRGPLGESLASAVASLQIKERVIFHGEKFDVEDLRDIFRSCVAMVAPGYVGLNVIQALGFGVAVVYPHDEPHAPEAEALNGDNSVPFHAGDAGSFAAAMCAVIQRFGGTAGARERLSAEARTSYSSERMADAFTSTMRQQLQEKV